MNLETKIQRFLQNKAELRIQNQDGNQPNQSNLLSPLLDVVGVRVLLQTLGDVVSNLYQALPGVLQLLALRQAFLRSVQLLQGRFYRPHPLLTLEHTQRPQLLLRGC